jgi:hypothetical protein
MSLVSVIEMVRQHPMAGFSPSGWLRPGTIAYRYIPLHDGDDKNMKYIVSKL